MVSLRSYGSGLSNFDIRPVWEQTTCDLTQTAQFAGFISQFERTQSDAGFGVTDTDFTTFYDSNLCCGGSCPLASYCTVHKHALFPASANGFKLFSTLSEDILRLNITELGLWDWRGFCRQGVHLNVAGDTSRSLTMSSGGGDIMVTSYHNG